MPGRKVAVAGATGAVGTEMLRVLERRDFPVSGMKLLASHRSVGRELEFRGEKIRVEELYLTTNWTMPWMPSLKWPGQEIQATAN